MDENTESTSAGESSASHRSAPPPPDLPQRSVAPPSPLDHKPQPETIPQRTPESAVKVKLHSGESPVEEETSASGIAPFNSRITAVVIDLVVACGIWYGLTLLLPGFAHKLAFLSGIAYLVTRDSLPFLGGQSVGKKAMKIRAVTLDGRPLTANWEPSLIRAGVLIIPFFAFVELYILLTRESTADQGIRLGDEWAKTRVIMEAVDGGADADG